MKRYKKEITFTSFENLVLSIYLVGYKNIGESIVVLFHDAGKEEKEPVFSFVVDSYKKDDLFLTKKILDDNEVKGLDIVCWTHPHRDHTPGIDEIVVTLTIRSNAQGPVPVKASGGCGRGYRNASRRG